MRSSYEGRQKGIRQRVMPAIEVWENQYPDKKYVVRIDTSEFTCICPKTGMPDFARIVVEYIPGKWCLELKSFKLYLSAYRNVGIFHEHLTNKVLDDVVAACKPCWAKIETEFNPRGGITTSVTREYRGKR